MEPFRIQNISKTLGSKGYSITLKSNDRSKVITVGIDSIYEFKNMQEANLFSSDINKYIHIGYLRIAKGVIKEPIIEPKEEVKEPQRNKEEVITSVINKEVEITEKNIKEYSNRESYKQFKKNKKRIRKNIEALKKKSRGN